MEFEFSEWCEENELNEETVKALKDKGYQSYKSLRLLTEESLNKNFKGLIPGQLALLREGVDLLRPTKTPQDNQQDNPQDHPQVPPTAATMNNGMTAGNLSQTMLSSLWTSITGADGPQVPQRPQEDEVPTDPSGLGTGPHTGERLRYIPDYVLYHQSLQPATDDADTIDIGGVAFRKAKPGAKKLPNNQVGIEHYMEGAMRILRELVIEDNISRNQIVNHINYLIQIACFAQTKRWSSVVAYDSIYRREQHIHGFA